ncbi:Chromatin structure-remodeling complex subunit RSC1 [Paramyrothecium foliicola]|nr:Chromatin structure-remodeling complex subunit RSC1 [Paramyrothecium foliicola]
MNWCRLFDAQHGQLATSTWIGSFARHCTFTASTMSTRRTAALEARNSIEARVGEEDVDMKDGSDDSESDAEGESVDGGSHDMYHIISKLSTYLCNIKEDGEELAAGFQRIPNRRVLPDYFEIISEPVAFSTVRGKLQKKQYGSFADFVKDVAQICHNAQVYNRPSAPIFGAAERLREIFKKELQKLVEKGEITTEEAQLPDLGELPPVEDSPPPGSDIEDEEEDEEDEDEDEDEDDDDDDSVDESGRRRRRRRGRASLSGRRDRDDDDAHKKRGRPPSVLTPLEGRITSLLRGLRKFKDEDGNLLVLPFEKLPDKSAMPDYYQTITQPIALDNIKKKAKRKKYADVDSVLADLELMFNNAKLFNEDDSEVYKAAAELQQHARELTAVEKAKSDDEFRDEDGKLPLAAIQRNDQLWRVGDWVHIRNPNDLAKPIVAQIYRMWQDREGQKWINACWYYRPEQTVHRYDKHFYDHEVVKTGQYRDHQIEDVLDRCFVMFVTRFPKGRPRGFPHDKAVYVCESRYNEERYRFAKIKTWASCVPDEVRERDYEMDLFEWPRRMRKVPSPIKHLLREDAKDTDELPKPTWGSPNAPPIVGAVHRRPRESNESPPPEPTPPPLVNPGAPQLPADPTRRPSMLSATRDIPSDLSVRNSSVPFAGPVPSPSPGHYNAHMTSHFQPATPGPGMPPVHQTPVPIPHPPQHVIPPQAPLQTIPYQPPPQPQHQPQHQHQHQFQHQPQQPRYPQSYAPSFPQSPAPMHQPMGNPLVATYAPGPVSPVANRNQMAQPQGVNMPHANAYNPPRPPEVYTLPDNLNEAFPPEVRRSFQHDEAGRILFFTAPPLERANKGVSSSSAGLGHSIKYLAGRKEWLAERERKRKERDEKDGEATSKRSNGDNHGNAAARAVVSQAVEAMDQWFQHFDQDTQRWEKDAGLEGWRNKAVNGGSSVA